MPLFHHPVARAFAGDRQAVELPRQPHREVAHINHFLNFTLTLRTDLACLQGDEQPEVGFLLAQGQADLPHDLAPPRWGKHPPAIKDMSGSIDYPVVDVWGGRQHCRDRLAGGGVDRYERLAPWIGNRLGVKSTAVLLIQVKAAQELGDHGLISSASCDTSWLSECNSTHRLVER